MTHPYDDKSSKKKICSDLLSRFSLPRSIAARCLVNSYPLRPTLVVTPSLFQLLYWFLFRSLLLSRYCCHGMFSLLLRSSSASLWFSWSVLSPPLIFVVLPLAMHVTFSFHCILIVALHTAPSRAVRTNTSVFDSSLPL